MPVQWFCAEVKQEANALFKKMCLSDTAVCVWREKGLVNGLCVGDSNISVWFGIIQNELRCSVLFKDC